MASFFNNFLKALAAGDTIADYRHASSVFVDDGYNLSPKSTFLYYVLFEFNENVRRFTDFNTDQTRTYEIGVLVKEAQLPNFEITLAEKNQYGKHVYTQTRINYNPVQLVFHDDMSNTINEFWANYYKYYYADATNPAATKNESSYKYTPDFDTNSYGYKGFDATGTSVQPFLKSVKIYSLHKKDFTEYTLVNPTISSMVHGTHSSTGSGLMDHTMTLRYQSVLYGNGQVAQGSPAGFTLRYDTAPSSISTGTTSINGTGGLIGSLNGIVQDLGNGNLFGAGIQALRTQNAFEGIDVRGVIVEETIQNISNTIRNTKVTTSNKDSATPLVVNQSAPIKTGVVLGVTTTGSKINIDGQNK